MIKNIVLIFSILLLSVFLVVTAYILKNKDICCKYDICQQLTNVCIEEEEEEDIGGDILSENGESIVLDNVKSGDVLYVGDIITGSVSGNWYFEGDFPVRILNKQGDTVDTLVAQATEDWMQDDFVSFSVKLEINIEQEEILVVRFEKSNPSGLDENSDSAQISITIKPLEVEEIVEAKTVKFKVFFSNSQLNPDMMDCSLVYPIQREVPFTVAVGRASLEELFKGLAGTEPDEGYFTNINDGVVIQSLTIDDGVAYVDLNSKLEEGVGGSCKVQAIRAQISETLKQFSSVDSVVISIDGRTEDILQP